MSDPAPHPASARAGPEAQALAERVAAAMWARDVASQALGMRLVRVGPGHAELSMTVRADMLNGHAICHGGFIFTLCDSAFAYACNSYDLNTVASGCSIDFLAPAREGDVLTAHRAGACSSPGRTGVYDIDVANARGETDRALPRQELPDQGPRDRYGEGLSAPSRRPHRPTEEAAPPCPSRAPPRRARADRDRQPRRARGAAAPAAALDARHAYDHVPHYRRAFDAAGVHPGDLQLARRPREVPVHDQGGPARQLPVRDVRRAARAGRAHPRVVGNDRQADRGRLYARRTSTPGRR